MLPPGMYLDKTIQVTKQELLLETDYLNEARNQLKLKQLFSSDGVIFIPDVIMSLTTPRVFTSEFIYGERVDKLDEYDQETRDYVGYKLMQITLRELFEFQFMQTDPNWTNFFLEFRYSKVDVS